MKITVEQIDQEIEKVRQQKQSMIANVNACEGAIQTLLQIKVTLKAPEPEKKKQEVVVHNALDEKRK